MYVKIISSAHILIQELVLELIHLARFFVESFSVLSHFQTQMKVVIEVHYLDSYLYLDFEFLVL